jgi:hypothetical protein
MGTNVASTPYLATLQITFTGIPAELAADLGDLLMVALLENSEVVDPILTSDLDTGELCVSYEFEATGEVRADTAKAIAILVDTARTQAARLKEPKTAFSWKSWLEGLSRRPAGTVQYPIAPVPA